MRVPLILERNWWQRSFSKVSKGSMRSSIFAMISSALGTGCLSMPVVMRDTGVIIGPVLLLFSAWISLRGMNNISLAAGHYKIYDYSTLVRTKLGRGYGYFLDFVLVIFLFFCLVAYHLIIYSCAAEGLLSLGLDIRPYSLLIRSLFTIAVIFPLSLFKKITEAHFLSILGIGCVLYITTLVVSQTYLFIPQNDYTEDLNLFTLDLRVFPSICICIYSFICHMNVASIFSEMRNPELRRMKKTNSRAISFQFAVYLLIGIFGYVSCLQDTPPLIIQREKPDRIHSDWLMFVGQVLVSIVVFVGFIYSVIPCRHYLEQVMRNMFFLKYRSNLTHAVNVSVLVFGSFTLALYAPGVINVLEFLGATCPLFCNLLPAILVAKIQIRESPVRCALEVALALLVCLIGIVTVVLQYF